MTIITISSDAFSNGEEVAEKLAQRLGYQNIRRELIAKAAVRFAIPLAKIEQAVHDAPTILDKFSSVKQKYINYVAAEVLACFQNDNIVYSGYAGHLFTRTLSNISAKILAYFRKENVSYNGFAGHFFASSISHLVNVRISADLEDRVGLLLQKHSLSRLQATKLLTKEDNIRKLWSSRFYGVDTLDPGLYDLMIHLNKLTVDDAVDNIYQTVIQPKFKATLQSQQTIENLALAAGIKAVLQDEYPECYVIAEGRSVEIFVRYTLHTDTLISSKITERVLKIPEISNVSVILIPSVVFT